MPRSKGEQPNPDITLSRETAEALYLHLRTFDAMELIGRDPELWPPLLELAEVLARSEARP